MIEIRRIHPQEAVAVTELWDQMARSVDDGGPLSQRGRSNIESLLRSAADHESVFCFVAIQHASVIGFALARTWMYPLLPGIGGEIEEFYVAPELRMRGVSRALAERCVSHLRSMGADIIWHHVCRDDDSAQGFWRHLGFEDDTVRFALYPD